MIDYMCAYTVLDRCILSYIELEYWKTDLGKSWNEPIQVLYLWFDYQLICVWALGNTSVEPLTFVGCVQGGGVIVCRWFIRLYVHMGCVYTSQGNQSKQKKKVNQTYRKTQDTSQQKCRATGHTGNGNQEYRIAGINGTQTKNRQLKSTDLNTLGE